MQTKAFKISVLIIVAFSIACSRIPLLNYLGFEFSAITAVLAGYLCGLLLLALLKKSEFRKNSEVWHFIVRTFFIQSAIIFIPLLISLANILFVKNCSIGNGIVLFVLLVIPAVIFSSSLAMLVGALSNSWQKTIFSKVYIIVLLHIAIVTYFRPQIFAFNPIIGFFPGVTYDETMQITHRLLIYRLAVLAASGCLFSASIWIRQIRLFKKELKAESRPSVPFTEVIVLSILLPVVIVTLLYSDRLGLSSSRQYIQDKLVGNYKTEHFEIIYPAGSIKRDKIAELGDLHEYYYQKITESLNVTPQERIVSFIYSSPDEKQKFIGAGSTDISKPWLRQIHSNLADVESVLKHEMVHVIAAEFGWSPLKISHNSGIIEGIAVAIGDDESYNEPLHRSAALVYASGILPDMASIFSLTGFAHQYPGTSYTLAGSFSKFLIDSLGIEKFKRLYATGDFKSTYQCEFSKLVLYWEKMIKSQSLTMIDTVKAKYLFRRPSIFGKECARVIANINSESRKLIASRDFNNALSSVEKSISLSKTPQAVVQKSTVLFELQRYNDVVDFDTVQLRDTMLLASLLPLHMQLGDAYLALDSLDKAGHEYKYIADFHLSPAYDEACMLRLQALGDERNRRQLKIYFTRSMEDTDRINWLSRLSSPIAKYLLARELAVKEKYTEAFSLLEKIDSSDYKPFEFFYYSRIGKLYFSLKDWKRAYIIFGKAVPIATNPVDNFRLKEWQERCEFELTRHSNR